jgi:hypothetical protein
MIDVIAHKDIWVRGLLTWQRIRLYVRLLARRGWGSILDGVPDPPGTPAGGLARLHGTFQVGKVRLKFQFLKFRQYF